MSFNRMRTFVALLALAPLLSCHCQDKLANSCNATTQNGQSCSTNTDCSDHYKCGTATKPGAQACCEFADRTCNTEADCCPGQQCPSTRHKCFDKFIECKTDADCGNTDGTGDLFCQTWKDHYGTTQRCEFKPCDSLGACPNGQSCFQGQCLGSLPCGGSCPSGDGCVPEAQPGGFCQQFACPVSCKPGFIATFSDDINIWDTCNYATEKCQCVELPPLHSNDLGRFSSLAVDGASGGLLVSEYDGQYGDLVLNKFDGAGNLLKQQYVDGVPSTGTVQYGPSGPRGGIVDPGEDDGRYSSVAVNGAAAYVSYYDETNGDLKLAVRQSDGTTWNVIRVDGTNADLGLYTSVAVDATGNPGISYFQRGGSTGFNVSSCPSPAPSGPVAFITALKYAHANKPNPQSASDFTILTLACQSRPTQACYGCTDVCADPGTGPACYKAGTGCTGCDPNTETCVNNGGTAVCAKKYNPSTLADIVDGVGLFSRLTYVGNVADIVYVNRVNAVGNLYGIAVNGNTPSAPVLLDGTDDTGYFPDLQIDPASGNLTIAYHDFTTHSLKFYSAQGFQTGVTPQVIDTGAGPAGSGISTFVGESSTIAFAPNGAGTYVAYEDATNNDLKLAVLNSSWEILPPLHTQDAVGFFASGKFVGGTLWVSHAKIHAKTVQGAPTVDNSLQLDKYTPP